MSHKIIFKIASGTFGTVYKIQDSKSGKFFALKLIHENYKNEKEIKRIKRGFETAQKVSHPNCVKMIEWYEKGKDVGFVMEFVESVETQNLASSEKNNSIVETQNLASLQEKISKIIQIANGLEALHSKGIVHRDLKPANILESKEGQIKITDFDLVKLDDSSTLTASGAFLGTAKYSSPEQCQNSAKIDHKSDLYSLGVLFYQLICGRVPFEGNSLAEIALAHIRTPLISPKQFVPDLPDVLNNVISKLLKKNPKDRFNSAQEVSKILNTFLKEGKVENLEIFGDFLLTPGFVGRRKEFTILNKIFSEANNKLKTVLLSGEQGVGKTKLWKEFRLGLPQNSTLVFETKCKQNGSVFEPLSSILSKALEQIENLPSKEQAEMVGKLGRDFSKILPELKQKLFYKHLPEIPELEGNDSELRLFDALINFLQNIQKENQTLVFFFDDLQWVDEQSLKFLLFLKRNLVENSVLLIGTIRIEEIDKIKIVIKDSEILSLENFKLEEIREFLTKMFGNADPVNTRFCEEILKRTSGNVLFIQELMFHLLETKKLNKSEGNWDLGEESFSELILPKSIQSVVEERLNYLPKDIRNLLEIGSLLGKHFTTKVIVGILAVKEDKIESKLKDPILKGILDKSENEIFEFVNDSFGESISNSINTKIKKSLHKKIAAYLEKNFVETEILEELANHFFEARVKKKSFEFCLKTGEKFKELFLYERAKPFYYKVLELAKTLKMNEDYLRSLVEIGDLEFKTSKVEKAMEFYSESLQLSQNLSNHNIYFKSAQVIGRIHSLKGNFDEALNFYSKGLDLSIELSQKFWEAEFLADMAIPFVRQRKLEKAKEYFYQAEKLFLAKNNLKSTSKIYVNIAHIFYLEKDYERSIYNLEKALEIQEKGKNKNEMAMTLGNLGVVYNEFENLEKARFYLLKAYNLSKEIGAFSTQTSQVVGLATIYHNDGDNENAEKLYKEAISALKKLNEKPSLGIAYYNLGTLYKERGVIENNRIFFDKSLKYFEDSISISKLLKAEETTAIFLISLAELYYFRNELDKALNLNNECLEIAKKVNDSSIINNSKELKFLIEFKKGNKDFAIENLIALLKNENLDLKQKASINYNIFICLNEYPIFRFMEQIDSFRENSIRLYTKHLEKKNEFYLRNRVNTLKEMGKNQFSLKPQFLNSLLKFITPETAFSEIIKYITQETDANNCQIILEKENGFEVCETTQNLNDEDINFSTTVLKKAISEQKATLLKNVLEVPELSQNKSIIGKIFLSVIAVPLFIENLPIGAIYLDRTEISKGFFTDSDLEKVKYIAQFLSPILKRQNEILNLQINSEVHNLGIFIGNSPKMQEVYTQIEDAAEVNFTVYIYGETGTGKELVAEALHKLSLRRKNKFIAVNCSAIPNDLAESELFGHEKGAFSGAIATKKGKFELASQGTLFLDEIAELSLDLQAKLLRVLQTNKLWRVGGENEIEINTRIVCATNRDLKEEVKKGNFREDLFYRLNILKIEIPPLRERNEDIHLLANFFLQKYSKELNRKKLSFSKEAIIGMLSYEWKGNVRELENTIAKVVVKHKSEEPISLNEILDSEKIENLLNLVSESKTRHPQNEFYSLDELADVLKFVEGKKLTAKLEILTDAILLETLKRNNGNKSKAAEELGTSRRRFANFN